ncbi:arsenate reductase [Solimonas sp. K1W22B-7]|uniref:ArsC/Spx/MgsR family protein n=1 Tax=Solimonas sp. K1W22B-7 TaxID=2303331 RepID=UPI000E32E737|nr:ArsC/Spx/MgsR family protein [Solimonas sp. K1W22B-7]AXQ31383.1 arsenate reductase [Solimonas sp. K1W22B-7]
MVVVHGIKNCDTVQRTLRRLTEAGVAYRFHDFKAEGLPRELAQSWIDALGVDTVVNRKGTTWRKLDEATREGLNAGNAAALLSSQPSLAKRPVIAKGKWVHAGFALADEEAILKMLR